MEHWIQKIWHHLWFKVSLALFWFIVVWWLMETPMPAVTLPMPFDGVIDKLVHWLVFLLLTIFIWRILKISLHNRWARLTWAFGLVASYAYVIESWQRYVPTRSFSWLDLSFSILGVVSALLLIYWIRESKPRLLVHLCCGPCAAGAIRELKKKYFPVLLFSNSNIDSQEEFNKRWRAAWKLANFYGLKLVKSRYGHLEWLEQIKGHENAPERGSRCQICYRYRMSEAAITAKFYGYDFFTTSLTTSPHKDKQAVMSIGRDLERTLGVKFLDFDFSADNGYQASIVESKKLKLYRQKYCGCEFSKGCLKK